MNTPYTTPTGVQIGILHTPKKQPTDTSQDAVRLQRALLASQPKAASARSCYELGVCQSRIPACAGCTAQPKDSWQALCFWLTRRFG